MFIRIIYHAVPKPYMTPPLVVPVNEIGDGGGYLRFGTDGKAEYGEKPVLIPSNGTDRTSRLSTGCLYMRGPSPLPGDQPNYFEWRLQAESQGGIGLNPDSIDWRVYQGINSDPTTGLLDWTKGAVWEVKEGFWDPPLQPGVRQSESHPMGFTPLDGIPRRAVTGLCEWDSGRFGATVNGVVCGFTFQPPDGTEPRSVLAFDGNEVLYVYGVDCGFRWQVKDHAFAFMPGPDDGYWALPFVAGSGPAAGYMKTGYDTIGTTLAVYGRGYLFEPRAATTVDTPGAGGELYVDAADGRPKMRLASGEVFQFSGTIE